jgi:SAM-dependent methyltransferase
VTQTPWDRFFERAVRDALQPATRVLDVGAGLRADPHRGNRLDPRRAWIQPLLQRVRCDVIDPVDTYRPSLVGDVQALPFKADSYDAVICLAVLEHVPRPWEGVREMRRVLQAGGLLFLYVPFLIPYHAEPGYYSDYWRFTNEGLKTLLSDFDDIRMEPVRGPAETLAHMLPAGFTLRLLPSIGRQIDRLRRASGRQTSGFFTTARKPSPAGACRSADISACVS